MKHKILCIALVVMLGTITWSVTAAVQKDQVKHNTNVMSTGQGDTWPMFRHDPGNTGCSDSLAPNTNQLRWKSVIADYILMTVPVIDNDKMFLSTGFYYDQLDPPNITDRDYEFPNMIDYIYDIFSFNEEYYGGIYCLDAITGSQIWSNPMYAPNEPAVVGDRVYTSDLNLYGYYSNLYCLDANTGVPIWTNPIPGLSVAPTIVSGNSIYVASLDLYTMAGTVFSYDTNGNPIWEYALPPYETIWFSAPAVCDGKIYFITVDLYSYYSGILYCLDAETGEFIWSQPVSSFWFYFGGPTPVCRDGKLYLIEFNIGSYTGSLKCYDADSGNPLWTYSLGYTLSLGLPAVNEDSVFVSGFDLYTYNSWLYRISTVNQSLLWKVPVPGASYFFGSGSPVCSRDKVILCPSSYYAYSNTVYCYDLGSGAMEWIYLLDYDSISSPSVADDTVFLSDYYGNIYAIADQLQFGEFSGGLLKIGIDIENIGTTVLDDITWSINCTGGMLGLIDRGDTGAISNLAGGTSETVHASPVFGLGTVQVEAMVTRPDMKPIRKTGEAMVIGPFVMMTG